MATDVFRPQLSDRQLLDQAIISRTRAGWRIVSQSDGGVQFAKPRQWNAPALAFFVALPIVFGLVWPWLWLVAIISLALIAVDRLIKPEPVLYVTPADVRAHLDRLAHGE